MPIEYVRQQVEKLQASNARVATVYIDSADHFLIFSHRIDLVRELVSWNASHE